MELKGYGITLKRMEYRDIEMVRMWRNSDFVRQFMVYREHITIEMQKRWFYRLGEDNYYFIIYLNSYPVGTSYIKDIKDDRGYFGIFIATEEALKASPSLSYRVMFNVLDFAFDTLLLTMIDASILKTNPRASRFNESIGFKPDNTKSDDTRNYYTLTKADYQKESVKIKNIIKRS